MKKLFLSLALAASLFTARADEGMWLPFLLGQQVYNDMVKKGLKLSKEQLYSINKASIKDAIIIFGGGCTGEIVSNQGLIFTNHHCGYGAIAAASSMKNNYLRDGFYAFSKDQELQTNLTVQFLERIEDVTDEVESQLKGLNWDDRTKKLQEIYKKIIDRASDKDNGVTARIYSMFNGNQYIMYVYKIYRDIRLVVTPPESVGKFGGDSDNWEWPRHTGDFAVFRVYTAPNGQPAEYSKENVPMKPKYFLPVSLKGVEEGSFAMIYGYPGGTNRYETSMGIKLKNEIDNPTLVKLRDVRLKFMHEEMVKDPAVKLKLASSYAGIANYWKFFDGETKQLKKFNTYQKKQDFEKKFSQWAQGKPEYQNLIAEYEKNYAAWMPYAKHRQFLREGILGSSLAGFTSSLISLENTLAKADASGEDINKAIEAAKRSRTRFIENSHLPSDERILAKVMMMFYEEVDRSQHPEGIFNAIRQQYGSLEDEATWKKMANDVFTNTMFTDEGKWNAFISNPQVNTLRDDIAFKTIAPFTINYTDKYADHFTAFQTRNAELNRSYMKGIMAMDPQGAKKMYPDANFSMRVSYGSVKSYTPRDAVKYDFVTTSQGILEKYVPGDYEYDLPEKQIELLKKRDFGQYIDKKRNDLVIGFITNHDITGGNSGSPVIDGEGNLIGLAFDGNYEALSHKIEFDTELNRTINVDIRYVLWCIDKLGGAQNIINELKLVR